ILKHSGANSVTFSYEIVSDNKICLVISDNGKGYKADKLQEGNGLKNIQNRTRKLKGELLIASRPGKGTTTKLLINIT
ncbi:MAG: ATP-binding protein, partial [Mucilaginibacter sp.]